MLSVSFSALTAVEKLSSGKDKAAAKHLVDTYVALVGESLALPPQAASWDEAAEGALTAALQQGRFSGKKNQCLTLLAPRGVPIARILLLGIGKETEMGLQDALAIGGALIAPLNQAGARKARLFAQTTSAWQHEALFAAAFAHGAQLKSYRFDKYHTKRTKDDKPTLLALDVALTDVTTAETQHETHEKIAEAVCFTRDLVTEPANIIYPESLAEACQSLGKLGVNVEVLGEKEMKKLGMGSLLGVGQGSARESQLVVMEWNGLEQGKGKPSKGAGPLAFVGKGVTFDTGGISIKPANGMEEMKWDMGGAATVIGLMRALAARKAKVHVVGVAGLVENMPDGNAQRPGDVVTSMSGQTIEVLNTDAEGRLVLADALWYTQERFKPRLVIDLATLTGAIIVALGTSRAGIFSNNDALAEQLRKAGDASGEEVWRLPLAEVYDKQINSDIADMQNIGKDREAGSITAAQFLQRFIKDKETPWAHIDIAGVAWTAKGNATAPKGATGYGVRLLNQLIVDYYEG